LKEKKLEFLIFVLCLRVRQVAGKPKVERTY